MRKPKQEKDKANEVPQMPSGEKKSVERKKTDLPIVGIGASAGGLEALEQFFANMPTDTGMSFVIIQHLDPNREGIMPQLLQRFTPMKVLQATDGLRVEHNFVYIIPPNKSLSILNGALHLFDPVEPHGFRLPIDIFFRSLAIDRGENSIGIILSGMGSDGSLGLKAMKETNGLVLVQDPATAKFDGMPRSAMEAVIADIVAPVEKLPELLIKYLKINPPAKKNYPENYKTQTDIDKIIILLREQSGHDFSLYKKSTILRRIERRKGIHQLEKIEHYVRFLQGNPKEVEILFKELLIGVTSFFRDPPVWEKLKKVILPELIEGLPNGYVIRAWIPGCSTGEEAYSLAITFKEVMDKMKKNKNIALQIFATDLDSFAIEKARKGIYASNIDVDVSQERIGRYFSLEPEGYRVSKSIREMIVFAPQNVIKDPPFTRLNILSCRNMLIYMEPELQRKLLSLFWYSLVPNGIMMLGTAETIGHMNTKFKDSYGKLRIFKRSGAGQSHELVDFPSAFTYKKDETIKRDEAPKVSESVQSITEQILLQNFIPTSVLVNNKGDILYITGNIGKYLELVAGKVNWNIHAMVREGLRNELAGAFRKALQNFSTVIIRKAKFGADPQAVNMVDITVKYIENPESVRGLVLVVFTDVSPESHSRKPKAGKQKAPSRETEMEAELARSTEELQSTREEMVTSQEELRSINEELQSTNEELQSTNEELTTSKEEMQSLNEELQTVNSELQSKVNDLLRINDDMKNLLNSTEIATLFLDKELNIRRYTDLVAKIIKMRGGDIGRPFTDLVSDLEYPDVKEQAMEVLKNLVPVEKAIAASDGRWFNVRIMPYRTLDDRIDGLVITFMDITLFKQMQFELEKANSLLKN